eukprot:NODE_1600_length_1444_cov_36.983295_g1518_i0.p1 GENE.NODE_1600_length_1444_cov_36.983295_g1518_i0~~NODE_1600_length_1444_cov_36.983295_g1518_i0.p1  ORF type:complete len:249 (-),score=67.87 NODE_1600_length_1444_cov_36.983295_g1518_i0:54-800(-)
MARHKKLGVGFISIHLVAPFESINNPKILISRLELLSEFVTNFGFKSGELSTEATMTFAVSTFQSPNGRVRKTAVNLIIEVYKKAGNIVRTYIENQKPTLVSELKSKIMKIARKDRTKSAPIQRLVTIVQPLGVDDEEEQAKHRRPKSFPSTIGDMDQAETMTVRERVQQWRQTKEEQNEGPQEDYIQEGSLVVGREKLAERRRKKEDWDSEADSPEMLQLKPSTSIKQELMQGPPKTSSIRGRKVFL